MMLCGDGQHSRHQSHPLLSPTFRSHQLWAPLHLERVTISDRKYQQYLKNSIVTPSHRLLCGGKKYGDDGFFLQKNIPVEQNYDKTLLLKSDVRPWDQTVPRPLTTGQILEKESHLRFPSQHPFTSHISQFAVFPDSKMSMYEVIPLSSQIDEDNERNNYTTNNANGRMIKFTEGTRVNDGSHEIKKVDAYIQTDVTCFEQSNPQLPKSLIKSKTPINAVRRKAYSDGVRVEVVNTDTYTNRYQEPLPRLCTHPGIYRWDVSRKIAKTKGLIKPSLTYPIPSTMYSPMEHPLTTTSNNHGGTTGTKTFEALNSVNKRVSASTAYTDNYSLSIGQSRQIFRRESQSGPPAVNLMDSRGKYARATQFSAVCKTAEKPKPRSVAKTCRTQATQTDDHCEADDENDDDEEIQEEVLKQIQGQKQYYTAAVGRIPSTAHSTGRESYLQPSSRGSSASYDEDGFLYNSTMGQDSTPPYSKSNAMKSFHTKYNDQNIPDLRQYSISSGRRHVINGYHAYYWH